MNGVIGCGLVRIFFKRKVIGKIVRGGGLEGRKDWGSGMCMREDGVVEVFRVIVGEEMVLKGKKERLIRSEGFRGWGMERLENLKVGVG